jgi:Arc/MetJ-type ribon-helix-helix transcriptional regulator
MDAPQTPVDQARSRRSQRLHVRMTPQEMELLRMLRQHRKQNASEVIRSGLRVLFNFRKISEARNVVRTTNETSPAYEPLGRSECALME